MAITRVYLPLTQARFKEFGDVGLRSTLKVYQAFTEVGRGSRLKRILCLGPTGVINCTPLLVLLSEFVSQNAWLQH